MSHMLQPAMVLLREGTENSQGKEQIISNINSCQALVEIVKTTLVINYSNVLGSPRNGQNDSF